MVTETQTMDVCSQAAVPTRSATENLLTELHYECAFIMIPFIYTCSILAAQRALGG